MLFKSVVQTSARCYHTTSVCAAGRKWRLENGLGAHPHEFTPLMDWPDWSFADGRPALPTKRELERKERQAEFARSAVTMMKEMREARSMLANQIETEERQKEAAIKRRLKPRI